MHDALQFMIYVAYGFIMAATGVVTALVTSFCTNRLAMVVWKELSKAALLRIRLITGAGGAILAYSLLGNFNLGAGFGLGPGAGTGVGAGKGDGVSQPTVGIKADSLAPREKPEERATVEKPNAIKIAILGPETQPAYEPKSRFFAFVGDAGPRALDVEGVLERVAELKKESPLREVEFVVTDKSTSIQNVEVQRLRQSLEKAGLRVIVPNVDNPTAPSPPIK